MALWIGKSAVILGGGVDGKVDVGKLDGALGQLAFGEGWPEPYTVHTLDLDELSPSLPHGEDVAVDPVADFFGEGEADPHAQNGEFCGQFMTPDVCWYAPLGEMGTGDGPDSVSGLAYFRSGGSAKDVREADGYRTWGVGTDQDDSIGMTLRLTREDECSSPGAGTVWFDNARLDVSDILWEFNASHGAGRWYQLYQMPYHGKVRFSFPNATNNVVARAFSSDPTEWVQSVRIDPVVDPMAELNLPMTWEPNFRLIDTETGKNLAGPDVLRSEMRRSPTATLLSIQEQNLSYPFDPYAAFSRPAHRVWSMYVGSNAPTPSGDEYAYFDVDLPPAQYVLSMDVEVQSASGGTWGGESDWGQAGFALGYAEAPDTSGGFPMQEAATPPRAYPGQWSGPQVREGVYRPTLVMDIQEGRTTRIYLFPSWNASDGSGGGDGMTYRISRVQIERGVVATPYEPYQRWGLVVWNPSEGGAGNPRYTAASDGYNSYWAPESCDPSEPLGIQLGDGEEFDDTHRCEMWLPTGAWRFTALDRRDGPMEAEEVVLIPV